ncbi:hypothetical protein CEXT_587121 [Caerostris extrusa]|uniref:Uncharacterized protein n=1 Tax=Caerostris extrusa TaxID=172846 RepID=A0AAV4RRY5_CAEEX|nr:hypothetical protein CEXT_587121 [Caerostris extrusa]
MSQDTDIYSFGSRLISLLYREGGMFESFQKRRMERFEEDPVMYQVLFRKVLGAVHGKNDSLYENRAINRRILGKEYLLSAGC